MARRAVCGEHTRDMSGVYCARELTHVARLAVRRGTGKSVVCVASSALDCTVRPRQGEARQIMIELAAPCHRAQRVALLAVSAETRGPVCRAGRRIIRAPVTADAVDRHVDVFLLLLIHVARLAGERLVRPHQREARLGVPPWHIRHQPGLWRVAPIAGAAELVAVDIGMAVRAQGGRGRELQVLVALPAGKLGMLAVQGKFGLRVVKFHTAGRDRPGR